MLLRKASREKMKKLLILVFIAGFFYLFLKISNITHKQSQKSPPAFQSSYIILRQGSSLPLFGAIQSQRRLIGVSEILYNPEIELEARDYIPVKVPTISAPEQETNSLNLYSWTEICNKNIDSLIYHPLFPHLPEYKKSTVKLDLNIGKNTGVYLFGKLKPGMAGVYRFHALSTKIAFQVWLSSDENPSNSKLILHENLVRSKDLELFNSPYHISIVLKTGTSPGKFSLKWLTPGKKEYTLIPSNNLESYPPDSPMVREENLQKMMILDKKIPLRDMYDSDQNKRRALMFKLPFIPEEDIEGLFPKCNYDPSYLIKKKITKQYAGQWETHFTSVYPPDETDMVIYHPGMKDPHIIYGNPLLKRDVADFIVEKVVNAIKEKHKDKYQLKEILSVEQNEDDVKGDRYLVELELLNDQDEKTYRFAEYLYHPKGSNQLCYPENFKWNKTAEVNLIITSAGQSRWLIHFINTVNQIYKETNDENIAITIVDFDNKDTGVMKALKESPLKKYTYIRRKGKFHKTLALNDAAASITNPDAIVMQVDLHLVIPADFIDNVRKHTIQGRMACSPLLNRLQCGATPQHPTGYWEDEGYGIFGIYKSDWNYVGGMNAKGFQDKWGGEDWELLDSVLSHGFECERLKIKNFHHVFHSKKNMWNNLLFT